MIKSHQIDRLPETFHYLTALTKPQIRTLLKQGTIQLEFFDEDVVEVMAFGISYEGILAGRMKSIKAVKTSSKAFKSMWKRKTTICVIIPGLRRTKRLSG